MNTKKQSDADVVGVIEVKVDSGLGFTVNKGTFEISDGRVKVSAMQGSGGHREHNQYFSLSVAAKDGYYDFKDLVDAKLDMWEEMYDIHYEPRSGGGALYYDQSTRQVYGVFSLEMKLISKSPANVITPDQISLQTFFQFIADR